MGTTKVPSLQELGWNRRDYNAALAAEQTFYRGRKKHRAEDHEIRDKGDAQLALETAERWGRSYRHVLATGRYIHPGTKVVIAEWEITPNLESTFRVLLGLNETIRRRLQVKLKEMSSCAD